MKKQHYFLFLITLCLYAVNGFAQQWGDYTLYSIQNATTTQLLDTNRNVVKTWTHTGKKTGYSSYLMPGGYLWKTISRTGNSFTGGPICGEVIKMDWAGNILWDYVYSTTDYCTHHDFCPLPNGNVLLIAYERISAANVAAAGGTFSGEMWSEKVVEIKPTGATTGEVVWEWRVWDHLVQNTDASKPNYQTSIVEHPELLNVNYNAAKDWIHMNGIDYNPILDQISVSSHNLNEWYIIDHSTTTAQAASHVGGNAGKGGDFLYRWGNPAAYNASGTAILNVTHDAHWIPEGVPNAGRLVGFNNKGVSSSKSSVDQITTPLNGYNYTITAGSAFTPSTYDTRHACNGYSSNMGNSQQLPNGNMLVCLATAGTIYEVDANGTTLWTKTLTGSVPQSSKYNKCFVENEAPAIPVITENNSVLSANNASTYQWYKNGQIISNAINQNYTPTDSGIYVVRITDSIGCVYRYSAGYKFTINTTTGVNTIINDDEISIYPNPTTGLVKVTFNNSIKISTISIINMQGQLVATNSNQNEIDLSIIPNGLYFIQLTDEYNRSLIKKLVVNK